MVVDRDLDLIKQALRNWGAWVKQDALPDQRAALSAIWQYWRPHLGWESGWGDPAPPESSQYEVNERWAERVDAALHWIPREHFLVLKGVYAEDRYYQRERLDAACRALLDVVRAVPLDLVLG